METNVPQRRYSDDELRRILEAASHPSPASAEHPAGHGHTLEEIREIAREVGIDASAIDRAAANLDASERARQAATSFLGLPLTLHEERVVPRALTDDEMRRIGALAERVVNRNGVLRQRGDWVEWQDVKERVYVAIVREGARTRIRVIGDHAREFIAGLVVIGFAGLAAIAEAVRAASPVGWIGAVLAGAVAVGGIGLFWKWRSNVARGNMQELLDILEDALPPAQR